MRSDGEIRGKEFRVQPSIVVVPGLHDAPAHSLRGVRPPRVGGDAASTPPGAPPSLIQQSLLTSSASAKVEAAQRFNSPDPAFIPFTTTFCPTLPFPLPSLPLLHLCNHQHDEVHAGQFSTAHAALQVLSTARCLLIQSPPKADPLAARGTTAVGLGVSPDPSSSLKEGAQGTCGVAGTRVAPSRSSTRRPSRCGSEGSPCPTTTTRHTTTTTPTLIDTAGGAGYARAPDLKWST